MHWENLTDYYSAWAIYLIGAAGCGLAAWLFIRVFPRALVHFVVITLVVLLFTPFAIDSNTMILAPGIVCLGYSLISDEMATVKSVMKVMILIWTLAMLVSLVYQLLTRHSHKANQEQDDNNSERGYNPEKDYAEIHRNTPPQQTGPIEPTLNLHQIDISEPVIRAER